MSNKVFTFSSVLNLSGNTLFSTCNVSIEIGNFDDKSSKVCPAATSLLRFSKSLKASFLALSDASRFLISLSALEKGIWFSALIVLILYIAKPKSVSYGP